MQTSSYDSSTQQNLVPQGGQAGPRVKGQGGQDDIVLWSTHDPPARSPPNTNPRHKSKCQPQSP
eukprot:6460498-Amphidinium_carterae.1